MWGETGDAFRAIHTNLSLILAWVCLHQGHPLSQNKSYYSDSTTSGLLNV